MFLGIRPAGATRRDRPAAPPMTLAANRDPALSRVTSAGSSSGGDKDGQLSPGLAPRKPRTMSSVKQAGPVNGARTTVSTSGDKPLAPIAISPCWATALEPRDGCDPAERDIYDRLISTDWAQRPGLSRLCEWPAALRVVAYQCMNASFPCLILWGKDDLVHIYNAAFATTFGADRHPHSFGATWDNVWTDELENVQRKTEIQRIMRNGRGQSEHEQEYHLTTGDGSGAYRQVFATFNSLPILEHDGSIGGLVYYIHDDTLRVQSSLKDKVLMHLDLIRQECGSREEWFEKAHGFFDQEWVGNIYPIVCGMFRTRNNTDLATDSWELGLHLGCERSELPERIERSELSAVKRDCCGEAWTMRDYICWALAHGKSIEIRDPRLLEKLCKRRAYGDMTRIVVVTPQFLPQVDGPIAVNILGLCPRWEPDLQFVEQSMQSINRAISLVRYRIHEKEDAHRMQLGLLAELAEKTREMADYRERFEIFLQRSPSGCFIYDIEDEKFIYLNDTYYILTGQPLPEEPPSMRPIPDWAEYIHPEFKAAGMEKWANVQVGGISDFEARWRIDNEDGTERWTMSTSSVEQDSRGRRYIMGHFANISALKYAEQIERARADDAVSTKAAQLEWIDTLQHELRNALSAIGQSAELLIDRFEPADGGRPSSAASASQPGRQGSTEEDVDDLRTIVLCAQHMTRIINDTLNLSKLEAGHLAITMMPTNPLVVLSSVLTMFDAEAKRGGAVMELEIDPSIALLGVNHVLTDPARLAQIAINLVSNSIKFTSKADRREVTIRLAASRSSKLNYKHGADSRPSTARSSSTYKVPDGIDTPRVQPPDGAVDGEESPEDDIYLVVHVSDTGPGMSQTQVDGLFQRYYQCSAKTHVLYGGSGLGLYISKQLVTLLHGTISVSSIQGNGTTFSFNIRAKKCPAPRRSSAAAIGGRRARGVQEITVRCGAGVSPQAGKICLRQSSRPGTPLAIERRNPLERRVSNRSASGQAAAASVSGEAVPAADATKRSTSQQTQNPLQPKAGFTKGNNVPEKQPLILIAEDNLVNQRILCKQLKQAGYRTLVANNGKEAIDLLVTDRRAAAEVALCLCDVEMPILGGLGCIAEIRALEQGHLNRRDGVARAHRRDKSAHMTDANGMPLSAPATRESSEVGDDGDDLDDGNGADGVVSGGGGGGGSSGGRRPAPGDRFQHDLPTRVAALKGGHVPFIAVTANARQEQIHDMLHTGFDDALTKPFRLNDLIDKMRRYLPRDKEEEQEEDEEEDDSAEESG